MKVSWWINFIHIGLDYVLIFGLFGLKGFGVAGAAMATVIVRLIGTVVLYLYIKKSKVSFSLFGSYSKEDSISIMKLSTPAAIERLIMRLGQVLYFGLIVKIGADTYAAHSIAGNIETFSYMPGYGLAIAATTLVGQCVGAKRSKEAYQYGMMTTWIAVGFMSFVGVLLYFLSPWFATWFTTDKNAVNMVVTALRIDAFAQPALAIGLVLAGALQGAGDTKVRCTVQQLACGSYEFLVFIFSEFILKWESQESGFPLQSTYMLEHYSYFINLGRIQKQVPE